ncbi:MAG: response regulator transcription factor [Bacteroidetes bacterium]|nr:response regulator transcription factor [Bacteroidota bacterium]MBK8344248.1 response regulator transcription factor [Bacteroidota bacterium]
MNYRILIVEDEDHIRENLKLNLEMEGYEVIAVADGAKAIKAFKEQRFDLVILDVMLPEMDGFDVCEQIRLDDRETPILFLTAKDASIDKIKGLKTGGDDYMTKPFNLEELLLRIINLLKRTSKTPAEDKFHAYEFGGNVINFVTYEAKGINGDVKLTNKELKLLKLLIDRKNEVVSRTLILQTVWGYDVYPSTRTIDNFILAFRKYFEKDPKSPVYFHAIRGVGYKFADK